MNEEIFAKLCASKKYGDVHPDAIRRAIEDAERRYRKPKDVEKAARERLHGVTASYRRIARSEPSGDLEYLLSAHVSTKERLPLSRMDALYDRIIEVTGAPESVLDLACGLNPIYILRCFSCPVTGVDVSRACIELLSREPKFTGIWADLLSEGAIPAGRFHVALLFKILPLLERQRARSASEIMGKIDAEFLVASFPTRTLGGRNVNMERNYTEWMESHLPANRRVEARFVDENELFYILKES